MDKSAEVLLPDVPYFQVIFTLPDKLSSLILGNRSELYNLLFQSAWKALDSELRATAKFQPAALMVLHTWNQQLDHHPHLHALVPGAGPSIEGDDWKTAKHPTHRRRKKPYLSDNVELGRAFRKHYLRSLKRLLGQGKLQIGGTVEFLSDRVKRDEWFSSLEQTDWNVFIEGPPQGKSDPANVVKYLASYLTGGPISDRRIIRADKDEVWFWARPKKNSSSSKHRGMNRQQPFRLNALQFMRRWTMHILPKGLTRSRCYGGYHGSKRKSYLEKCRQLLSMPPEEASPEQVEPDEDSDSPQERTCPHCDSKLESIQYVRRPSWRQIFERDIYASDIYSPQHHIGTGRSPPGRGYRA
jgi:hypothetical protein